MVNILNSPTSEELRTARRRAQLTQTGAAKLVHASRRAWQTWESDGREHHDMPAAKWELFKIKVGEKHD